MHEKLSRRERQIMDVIYKAGSATASDVYKALADPPTDATIRKLIRVLEAKGHLTHKRSGREYVYRPTVPRSRASRDAAKRLLTTFFEGSAPRAVAALLSVSKDQLSTDDVKRLTELIEEAEEKEE